MVKTGNEKVQMLKKRLLSAIFAVAVALVVLLVHAEVAQAASLSLKASASTVKIGDSVTVTITVPGGISATVSLTYPTDMLTFVSASDTANANAGTVAMTIGSYGGSDAATSATVTFKASGAGKATFSVSAPIAGNNEGDQVSVDGASTSITVENAASDSTSGGSDSTSGAGDDNSAKSADNSLSSLSISPGTLSPEFKYSTTSYTASVANDVTSVTVSAKTSNSNATIDSVTGADKLSVGENKVQIVVKAENGVTATYTITVTRAAADESTATATDNDNADNNDGNDDGDDEDEPEEEPDEPEEDEETDISERYYSLNGAVLYPSATLPSDVSEEGFEQDEVMLWNEDYECLVDTFSGGEYILLWLEDEDGEDGQLALVLSDDLYEAYSYVCLRAENTFVIVLPSVAAPTEIMDGYSWGTRSIEGKGMVDALFLDGDSGSDFALVYCASSQGVAGWYRLDTSDLTFIRYVRDAAQEEDEPEEISTEAETETEEVSSEEEEKSGGRGHLVIGIIAIAVLVVVIVIILIFILRGRGIGGGDEDDDDDDIEFLDV